MSRGRAYRFVKSCRDFVKGSLVVSRGVVEGSQKEK
jgi:hypothetical protein